MKCICCDEEARAICRFCGRAVCREHIQQEHLVLGYRSAAVGLFSSTWRTLSVREAVWCGQCHPKHVDWRHRAV
jgi:hypothetical protein